MSSRLTIGGGASYLTALWLVAVSVTPSLGLVSNMTLKIDAATPADVSARFERDGREVLTFLGYSAAGYEDEPAMLAIAGKVLDEHPPATTIVNIGATPDGIGAIYRLAKDRGYRTSGIVSSKAKDDNVALSDHVDTVFFVKDDTWGGFRPGTRTLSPTSRAMVDNSNVLVAIGGGNIARDEMDIARSEGKRVRYYPADMNHAIAVGKAEKAGQPAPNDFGSPVDTVMKPER